MSDLVTVLSDFVRLFDEHRLPYAVMGGIAVRAYGVPRPTYDVDFTVAIERARLPRLYTAVRDAGYTVPEPYESGWVDQVAGMPVVKFRFYEGGRAIDVDTFLAESDYQREVMSRRQRAEVEEMTTWLATAEDLILLKLSAHRPRDLVDVADVLFIHGELDLAYMRVWADKLGVRDELERVLREAGR